MIFSKLDKLSMRDKVLIVVAIGMLIALAVDRFVVQKVFDITRNTELLIDSELKNLDYNNMVIASSGGVKENYLAVSGKLGKITNQDSDIDIMKGEIDDLARAAGLLVTSMKNREPKKYVHYTEYIVDIGGFEGKEGSLLKFLDAIQHSDVPGLLRVTHLNVGIGRQPNTIRGAMTITKVMVMREDNV